MTKTILSKMNYLKCIDLHACFKHVRKWVFKQAQNFQRGIIVHPCEHKWAVIAGIASSNWAGNILGTSSAENVIAVWDENVAWLHFQHNAAAIAEHCHCCKSDVDINFVFLAKFFLAKPIVKPSHTKNDERRDDYPITDQ